MVGFAAVDCPAVRELIVAEDADDSEDPDETSWADQTSQQASIGDHTTLGRYWSMIQSSGHR